MKKIIIGLLALMLTVTSLVSYSQTKDEAGQALNAGIALKDMDVNAAIEKFNDCIKICEQVGTEADDLKAQAEKVLPGLHFQSAMDLYKAKKLNKALAEFITTSEIADKYNNESIKSKCDDIIPQLYAAIGNNSLKAKDYAKAMINYEKAVELDSNSLKGHFGKALVYKNNDDNDKFKAEIDKMIEIGPADDKLVAKAVKTAIKHFQAQGGKAIMAKEYENGMNYLNTSISYGEDVKTYYYISVAHNAQQQWQEAIDAANKALELDKDGKMKAKINVEIENAKIGLEAK